MEAEQNTSLTYDILTGECEAAIRKHLARTDVLDSTGLEVEQAKACAMLSLCPAWLSRQKHPRGSSMRTGSA